jgi:predicted ABC-type ATPase
MESDRPKVVVIGGPNGAGKTTIAREFLPQFGIRTFVNADIIAQGLSMFDSENVAIQAGRVMLARLNELADERADFAFETTLASRSFATRLSAMIEAEYDFHLICVWVPSSAVSIGRIQHRVSHGGHFVPDDTVRRRYAACFRNFFQLSLPLADTWTLLNNSNLGSPQRIAEGEKNAETRVMQSQIWAQLKEEFGDDDSNRE